MWNNLRAVPVIVLTGGVSRSFRTPELLNSYAPVSFTCAEHAV